MKQIQLNPQQQEAISHRDGPLLVDDAQLNLMRFAMEKVKVEDDPALIMSKVSLWKRGR